MHDLIERTSELAKKSKARVGIGMGTEKREYVTHVIESVNAAKSFAKLITIGEKNMMKGIATDVEIFDSSKPEESLVKMLKKGEIDAAVRGSCRASLVLKNLKRIFKIEKIFRLALLGTADGRYFFFAPVGIDEGNTLEEKLTFVQLGAKFMEGLKVEPRVAVISGGRREDIDRCARADETIAAAESLIGEAEKTGIKNIRHYYILIEDAIKNGANLIIAPDGVTGNLMFRTLIFLGNGKVAGAPILNLDKVFIDTSRAQKTYVEAIMLANALAYVQSR